MPSGAHADVGMGKPIDAVSGSVVSGPAKRWAVALKASAVASLSRRLPSSGRTLCAEVGSESEEATACFCMLV